MVLFRIDKSFASDSYNIWIIEHDVNGKAKVAKPISIEFEEVIEGQLLPEPTLSINGQRAKEWIPELKKSLAGYTMFDDKEEYETAKRVEKAMQAHIDSLKLVVDRVVK